MEAVSIIKPIGSPVPAGSFIIYKVTNKINGKIYIGQSQNTLEWRRSRHIWEAHNRCKLHFHNALRKYGVESFKWQVICICPSLDSLNEQEEYYIAFYDSFWNGYNMTSGGSNALHSEATKQKMRQSAKNRPIISEETRKKMSESNRGKNNGFYGKNHSEKTKEKLRQANSRENSSKYGKHPSDETRQKMREAQLGRKHSKETIAKMCIVKQNISKETRKRMSIAKQNMSDETKKKISKTRIKNGVAKGKNNPMYGKKGKDSPLYGSKRTQEAREKMSGKNNPMYDRFGDKHPMYGIPRTEKTKEKIRQANLKYWQEKRKNNAGSLDSIQ